MNDRELLNGPWRRGLRSLNAAIVRTGTSFAIVQSFVVVVVITAAIPTPAISAEKTNIVGRWLAPDEDSSHPRAVIDIMLNESGIVGTIAELYAAPDEDSDPVCERCTGADHNRRIRGMAILFLDSSTLNGEYRGTILDPEEGRIYRCVVTANATGDRLTIRGYVGIPLLGRTETWIRAR